MKTVTFVLALAAATPAPPQQQQQMKPPTAEEIQKTLASLGPGSEHRDFDALVGTWDIDVTYNAGPGQKMTMRGRAVNKLILGGRFLTSESTSTNPKMGLTIETLSIYGFDRRHGHFTIVGYDSMGTYYVTAAGKKAPGAKEVVMKGEVEEHGGIKKYDMVLRWIDPDTYVSEIVFYLPAGPLKIAETTHRRTK